MKKCKSKCYEKIRSYKDDLEKKNIVILDQKQRIEKLIIEKDNLEKDFVNFKESIFMHSNNNSPDINGKTL